MQKEKDSKKELFEQETDIAGEIEDLKNKETSNWVLVWKRFKKSQRAIFGMGVILILITVAILAPVIAPYSPTETDITRMRETPSSDHWLGTDRVGRDILSRLIFGARTALLIGLLIVSVSGGLGVSLGLIAGVFSGWIDEIIMRVVDALIAFPVLIFAIAVSVALGSGLYPVIIAVGLIIWTRFARITRGEVISIRNEQFIEAGKAIGETKLDLIKRYFFPNILPSIIVVATLQMPAAIIYSATLNFLGVGAQPPSPAWGLMVKEGTDYMQFAPHTAVFSGAAIVITVLAFNFVGDGLREALDPIQR